MMSEMRYLSEAQDFANFFETEHAKRRQAHAAPFLQQLACLTDKQFLQRAKQMLKLTNESYARLGAECGLSDNTLCEVGRGDKATLHPLTRAKLVALMLALQKRHKLSEP